MKPHRVSLLIALILIVVLSSVVLADPFIACDPQAGVTKYELSLDDGQTWQDVPVASSGVDGFEFDIAMLDNGTYKLRARACNEFGCSVDSSPFQFSRTETWASPRPGVVKRVTVWKP